MQRPPPLWLMLLAAFLPMLPASARAADFALGGDEARALQRTIDSARTCAVCHADIAAQWAGSAHHFASFNNPYYVASVDDFRRERGNTASRFCAGCHDPLLVADGAIDGRGRRGPGRALDKAADDAQAGVVCLVCHSIDATSLEGNGLYHATLSPVPPPGPAHHARLRPAILGESELCASCHKVGLTEEVTRDRWQRGQDDYDPWLASAASGNGAAAVPRPSLRARCQDCHMPLVPAPLGDAAAKNGMVRSHRFLGANTALPSLRGDGEQLARTREFLRGTVSLDLTWVSAPSTSSASSLVDVLLRSRGVGHRFPGGTMDSNEVWIAVEALDAAGRLLGRSGALDGAGVLDPSAHLIRAQAVDGEGQPIARRDPQHARGIAWDTSLAPADPTLVRYRLPPGTERVRARLLYRKLSADYARYACASLPAATRARCENIPVVEIARAELTAAAPAAATWQQLLDRALALSDGVSERAGDAAPLLAAARAQAPDRAELELGRARAALALGQTDEAVAATLRAEQLAPAQPAALWLRATALWRAYRSAAARPAAEQLAALLPRDRNALTLLARVRALGGDAAGALAAAQRLLALDPDAADGHYESALALRALGRTRDADAAQGRYLRFRNAVEIDLGLRDKYRRLHPDRPDESEPLHIHIVR